jgi:hypothetical protein
MVSESYEVKAVAAAGKDFNLILFLAAMTTSQEKLPCLGFSIVE